MNVAFVLNIVNIAGIAAFVVFFGMTFCVIPLVELDILVLPMWKKKAQPKDEHPPLQGHGERLEGYSGIFPVRYRSPVVPAHSLLNRPSNPALDIVYGRPPCPRVDPRLIGEDQR